MPKISIREITDIISQFKHRDLITIVTAICRQTYISEEDLMMFSLNKNILPDSVKFICDYAEGMMFEIIQSRTTVALDPLDLMLSAKYQCWLENIIFKVLSHHIITLGVKYDILNDLYIETLKYIRGEE